MYMYVKAPLLILVTHKIKFAESVIQIKVLIKFIE